MKHMVSLRKNFTPLANIISSIGPVTVNGTTFIPRMYTRRSAGVNEFRPTLVRYSNLREYVVAMSHEETPQNVRLRFFNYNPFPNARWTNDNDPHHPLLMNPDDIAPDEFEKILINDIDYIMTAEMIINRKKTELIPIKHIDYESEGSASQIVSSKLSKHKMQLTWNDDQPVYPIKFIESDLDNRFWSTEMLTGLEFYSGVQHLMGEIEENYMCPADMSRMYAFAKQDAYLSLNLAISNLFYPQTANTQLLNDRPFPQTVTLPVTTRGIGFTVRRLSYYIVDLDNIHEFTGSLYRVSLAMFELKVSLANGSGPKDFDSLYIKEDMQHTLKTLGSNFIPLANIISSIGRVTVNGTTFVPGMYTRKNEFRPTLVRYSNLREYVVAMSHEETPQNVRLRFFKYNPFPNARWTNDNDAHHPLLMNPDDIAPAEFEKILKKDIEIIQTAIEFICHKYPKWMSEGRIDFEGEGSVSQIVSSQLSKHKIQLTWKNDQPLYSEIQFNGSDNKFWSTEILKEPQFYSGVQHLLGEIEENDMCQADMSRTSYMSKRDCHWNFDDAICHLFSSLPY